MVETHIIFAELTDEGLGFVHGSWCWSEHRESLLVHLTYCHTLRRKIYSFNILLKSVPCSRLKQVNLHFIHKHVGFLIQLNMNFRLHVTCLSL